jgi:hypothetical protein
VPVFKVPGMTYEFQVTVDCAAPHTLADWWADLLGWQVEPSNEAFIRRMIAEGHASEQETTTHNGSLVWKEGAAIVHPDGSGRRVLFPWVPDTKTGLGATFLHRARQGPYSWVTVADPEGNEFCVS